eukprot:6003197-Amphidinium_carterae.1
MRDALRDIIITGRWERLERRRHPAPKAPPQGITQPYHFKPLMTMRIPEILDGTRRRATTATTRRSLRYTSITEYSYLTTVSGQT